MEESPESLSNFVPINLRGVDVLVVHDDKVTLTYLSSLLQQYSFKVTTSEVATEATSIICNEEGKFKLVVAKANMPGMDIICFLDLLLQRDIILICTYFGGYDGATKEALIGGVVFILQEPIHLEDLKYVWQHVYHTRGNLENSNTNTNCKDKVDEEKARKRILDDNENNPIEKITQLTSDQVNFNNNDPWIVQQKTNEKREDNNNESTLEEERTKKTKKRIKVWTPELHQRFIEALSELGGRRNPKAREVLDKMNVPHLTVRQVASHMQRHKQQRQHEQDSINPTVTISSYFGGRTEFPTLHADLMSQNQSFQLQQNHGDAISPYGLARRLANYEGQHVNALVGNPVPTTLVNQSQSFLQQKITSSNAVIPYVPLTGFTDHGCQNVDSIATTSIKQNHGNALFPYEFPTRLDNYGKQNLDAVTQNLVPEASMNYNNQSFQLQGTQDNASFHYEFPMALANYRNQNMDVLQTSVPVASVNQNKYPFQLQTTQGYGTFSSDLPTGLANNGNQNLDILAQNSVPVASMIPNKSQGIANFSSEFPVGLDNHRSQNKVGLQNHVPTRLVNYRSQNPEDDVNNSMLIALTNQNKSQDVDPFKWVRKFLLEDN